MTEINEGSSTKTVEAKLHDELRLIQRCFDDNKGEDKNLKGQSKNEFKIESRILQDSRGKLNSFFD